MKKFIIKRCFVEEAVNVYTFAVEAETEEEALSLLDEDTWDYEYSSELEEIIDSMPQGEPVIVSIEEA